MIYLLKTEKTERIISSAQACSSLCEVSVNKVHHRHGQDINQSESKGYRDGHMRVLSF